MKLLRCVFALMFVCALSGMARADDFKLGVLDAPPTKIDYTGSPLTLSFSSCGKNTPITDGCVTIENDTGKTITSLLIDIVPSKYTIADGDGGCLSQKGITCTYTEINGDLYQFLFAGLDILATSEWCNSGNTFTIEEQGVDWKKFPDATVGPPTVTPEPASLLLLATGAFLIAGFVYRRRMDGATLGM